MSTVVAIDGLLATRRVWRGQSFPLAPPANAQSTGLAALDAVLPTGGWPESALTELLLPADGVGELELLWPTLARASADGGLVVLVAPPYVPYAPAWTAAGVRLAGVQVIQAGPRDALWASEQCLRSGACTAVLCWPHQPDDRALRRLQVAAETGQSMAFALRPLKSAANPSPAALRIAIEADARQRQLRVVKCRGAAVPPQPIAFPRSGPSSACVVP